MSATPFLGKVGLESQRMFVRDVWAKVTLVGHTTSASIKGYSDNPDVYVYVEDNTLTGEDSDTGFTSLQSNSDPTVIGILVKCGDAEELMAVEVPQAGIVGGTGWTTPRGTEGATNDITVTKEGTGDDGVTTNSNLSVTLSIADLDLDANISNHTFWIHFVYKAKMAVSV